MSIELMMRIYKLYSEILIYVVKTLSVSSKTSSVQYPIRPVVIVIVIVIITIKFFTIIVIVTVNLILKVIVIVIVIVDKVIVIHYYFAVTFCQTHNTFCPSNLTVT